MAKRSSNVSVKIGTNVVLYLWYIVLNYFILTRLWRAPEISVIQGDHSDTSPGDLRFWLQEITMTS